MKARLYDPLSGRFVAPDSIIPLPYSTQGWSRYSYVENDPVNRFDPSGRESCFKVDGMCVGRANNVYRQ